MDVFAARVIADAFTTGCRAVSATLESVMTRYCNQLQARDRSRIRLELTRMASRDSHASPKELKYIWKEFEDL